MELVGWIALIIIICYSAYPGKVKKLESKVKKLERKQEGVESMSKIINDMINAEVIKVNSQLLEKSLYFATKIVLLYEDFSKTKSKADFISKLHISLKETGESFIG